MFQAKSRNLSVISPPALVHGDLKSIEIRNSGKIILISSLTLIDGIVPIAFSVVETVNKFFSINKLNEGESRCSTRSH